MKTRIKAGLTLLAINVPWLYLVVDRVAHLFGVCIGG